MGCVKRHIYITKMANRELYKDVDSGIMTGLNCDNKLQDVKITCAIVCPLFQSNLRMVSAGLFIETKYEAGHSDPLDIMTRYF